MGLRSITSFLEQQFLNIFFFFNVFFFFFKCLGFRCPFISSIQLIITIFPNIVNIIITENYMLQSIFFTVFLFAVRFSRLMPCWPGLLLEATHDKRLVPSYGIFLFRLSVLVPSRPMLYHPGLFAEPSPACVLVPPFGIFLSKLLTFRKIR